MLTNKYKNRADKRLKLEQQIIEIIKKRRKSLPREGVRKLVKSLDDEFTKTNLKVGRDTLFNVLRKHQMLTLRKNIVPEQPTLCTGSTSIKTSLKMFKLQDLIKFGSLILPISEPLKDFVI